MRRKDREVTDPEVIRQILDNCEVCRLGLYDREKGDPYIVPMNFAYRLEGDTLTLYFHSAGEGRKLEIIRDNPKVCFELDTGHRLVPHALPCEYSFCFSSLMGTGTAEFLTAPAEKAEILSLLIRQLDGKDVSFTEKQTACVAVYQVVSTDFSCKVRKN